MATEGITPESASGDSSRNRSADHRRHVVLVGDPPFVEEEFIDDGPAGPGGGKQAAGDEPDLEQTGLPARGNRR